MSVKIRYKPIHPLSLLALHQSLIALFCSGGVFYIYKNLKLSIYLKPYFATLVMAQVAFFMPVKNFYKYNSLRTSFVLRQPKL